MNDVVRPCDADEKGAHSEKNARCGHIRENMPVERCRYDRGWAELEDNATHRAAWRKKLISYDQDPS